MIGGDGINDESNKTAPAPTRNTDLTKYTRPNDSAGSRLESLSYARPMSRCAPTDAPGAAIERRPWAASCSSPGLTWILTSVLPLSDTT